MDKESSCHVVTCCFWGDRGKPHEVMVWLDTQCAYARAHVCVYVGARKWEEKVKAAVEEEKWDKDGNLTKSFTAERGRRRKLLER